MLVFILGLITYKKDSIDKHYTFHNPSLSIYQVGEVWRFW